MIRWERPNEKPKLRENQSKSLIKPKTREQVSKSLFLVQGINTQFFLLFISFLTPQQILYLLGYWKL